MATKWVLHTETKGTGAQMVPLESIQKRPATPEPVSVPRKAQPAPKPQAPAPPPPRRFRVVDVLTRAVLVDDASTRQAVEALKDVRSAVDVNMYVWHEEQERWRLLTLADQRALLELAEKVG
jgi:hypothetical protein